MTGGVAQGVGPGTEKKKKKKKKKLKNRTTIQPRDTTPRHTADGMCSRIQLSHCTPMFSVALFTTAKLWKQPRYPTTNN
jgi:hypothetical protein